MTATVGEVGNVRCVWKAVRVRGTEETTARIANPSNRRSTSHGAISSAGIMLSVLSGHPSQHFYETLAAVLLQTTS